MQEEIQDIVNDNDEVVGVETRTKIWEKGLEHNVRTVNLFLFNPEGKLLVPKRSKTKKMWPGCYDFSCGENVVSGETYEKAAIRGLDEELGIKGVKPIPLGKLTPKDGIACFAMTFSCNYSGNMNTYSKDEVERVYWMTIAEVKALLKKNPEMFKRDYKETFEKYFS